MNKRFSYFRPVWYSEASQFRSSVYLSQPNNHLPEIMESSWTHEPHMGELYLQPRLARVQHAQQPKIRETSTISNIGELLADMPSFVREYLFWRSGGILLLLRGVI